MKEYEDRHVSSDDRLSTVNKELVTSSESNKKLQRELKDALQLREELEQRVSQLEQRYVSVQRECSSLSDLNNRLETELAIRENSLKHVTDTHPSINTIESLSKYPFIRPMRGTKICKLRWNHASKSTSSC